MRRSSACSISLCACAAVMMMGLAFAGCGHAPDEGTTGDPTGKPGGTSPQPNSLQPPNRCLGSGLDDVGCSCAAEGAQQNCWPGDPALRGRGDCTDGRQTCVFLAEVRQWGPCQGYNIGSSCTGQCVGGEFQSCDTGKEQISSTDSTGAAGGGGSSGGAGEGTGGTSGGSGSSSGGSSGGSWTPPTECIIGSWRWCDEPVYCNWGKQVCAPDGRWGRCSETNDRPGSCTDNAYDQDCCAMQSAGCCQDLANPEIDAQGHVVYPTLGTCK